MTLVLFLMLAGYLTYQHLPLFLQQQEVYRVLEEYGSKLSGQKGIYRQDANKREFLRRQMEADIRRLGVDDPQLETWIEIEGGEARLGAFYTHTLTWAFDLIAPQHKIYDIEHAFEL